MDIADVERFQKALSHAAESVGFPLTEEQQAQCLCYARHMLTINETLNLTRIVQPEAMAIKHFADSLTVFRALPPPAIGASVIDVGTGAGFPGMVLKIARPDIDVILLDGAAKRLHFLNDVIARLSLTHIRTVHARAEDAGRMPEHRERYSVVVARAVAPLPVLLEWCGPLVASGGHFIAMKGANGIEEWSAAQSVPAKLGLRAAPPVSLTLPNLSEDDGSPRRFLLPYTRIRPTLLRYPRSPGEIKRNPLA